MHWPLHNDLLALTMTMRFVIISIQKKRKQKKYRTFISWQLYANVHRFVHFLIVESQLIKANVSVCVFKYIAARIGSLFGPNCISDEYSHSICIIYTMKSKQKLWRYRNLVLDSGFGSNHKPNCILLSSIPFSCNSVVVNNNGKRLIVL